MLPELTATGKENEVASSAAEDGAGGVGAAKRRRVDHESTGINADRCCADAAGAEAKAETEAGEGHETYGSLEEATSSANFWKTQYYALHREKDSKGLEQRLHTLKDLSEQREAQLKRYMFDVERRLKEAKDELVEIKKANANAIPASSGDMLVDAFPSATESPLVDANDDGKAGAGAEAGIEMKEEMKELSSTVKTMQQIISHYKMLTAVKLVNVQADCFDVQIRNFQRSASATFRLTHLRSGKDGGSGAAEAELRLDPVDGAKYLPEFMRSPIEFGVDQCPSLLREALVTMFPDESGN